MTLPDPAIPAASADPECECCGRPMSRHMGFNHRTGECYVTKPASAETPDTSREVIVRLMDNADDPTVVHKPYPECSIGEPHRDCNVYHRRPAASAETRRLDK